MHMKEMTPSEFDTFRKKSITQRAKYHELDTELSSTDAILKAESEFSKICPQGIETPDQFFYNVILDNEVAVGYLWFAIRERQSSKRIFINDIAVQKKFHGQGFGSFMMAWLEERTRELGLTEIGLHVLGSNMEARGLYDKMGYSITNIDMSKKIFVANEG